MIVCQVLVRFDPVKEILKLRSQIYILVKKKIILNKIQVTMKTSVPPFFNHFSFGLNRKKLCGNESQEEETKHIHVRLPVYYILEQEISIAGANSDVAKTKQAKQIVFVVERWMQCLLFRLKSWSARETSRHPAFMGHCPTISHTCQLYLPNR